MNDVQIYQSEFPERVCQGHIYNNISYFERLSENEANYVEFKEEHAVVISQDCDLYQDHNLRENPPNSDAAPHDKFLLNILLLFFQQKERSVAAWDKNHQSLHLLAHK